MDPNQTIQSIEEDRDKALEWWEELLVYEYLEHNQLHQDARA